MALLHLFLVIHLLMLGRTALVTDHPSFTNRLEKLFEKLESLTVAPTETLSEKIAAKLDRLNSLNPLSEETLTDEDEELLSAMQLWGVSADQLGGIARELHDVRMENDEVKSEKLVEADYSDDGWNNDDEQQYYADGEDWDLDDDLGDASTPRPPAPAPGTPSSIIRHEHRATTVVSAVDPVAATNERPRILDDTSLTPSELSALRRSAIANMRGVLRAGRCLTPQPRWLSVRALAPAADTVYMPLCVQLHRCAPDSGCCYSEAEVCAPVEGKYVILPFYLHKANGNTSVARMMFYNHTRCACVARDTLMKRTERVDVRQVQSEIEERTEEPRLEQDDEMTAPPLLRRCTCPALFLARMQDNACSCICDWPDQSKRRDCLSLSRGREHFGLRDRVCIANGDCTLPNCDYGMYARSIGKCPYRRVRRFRSRRFQDKHL
ncbi:hypothetical protein JYU34_008525 [Plutella xylostella]|uniref:Platelet-derived growth factor (PDGF) family profile domain-containing protein n=1 Tax=Plutella xylostella TaxID=51655 RepID=A0ABQ7QL50_PLUXY|nr:hypothetical protein JYU34_008525 [Plutella xylostella]